MKNLAKKLLIFIPLVFILTLTNYFVDPSQVFKSETYEYDAAKILLEKHNVANVSNSDERLIQDFI